MSIVYLLILAAIAAVFLIFARKKSCGGKELVEKTKAGGEYVFRSGAVVKILPVQKMLVLGDGTEIRIEDIVDISGELFAGEF